MLRTVGDVSSDAGDGLADCAHLGLAPLDVDLRSILEYHFQPVVVPSLLLQGYGHQ